MVIADCHKSDLENQSNEPVVVVTVSGGVPMVVKKPKGVKLVIRDYDVDGVEENLLTQDPSGDDCVESVWKSGDMLDNEELFN